jgi:hypothetical protein
VVVRPGEVADPSVDLFVIVPRPLGAELEDAPPLVAVACAQEVKEPWQRVTVGEGRVGDGRSGCYYYLAGC